MDVPNHVMARFRRMMNLEAPDSEAAGPAIPEFVGHYRVGRILGTGASAVVCEAEDLTLKRRVALKILRPDGEGQAFLSRFHREASLAANLKHPHLITIHEVAMVRQPDGASLHYIVMDCVPLTLRESVERSGRPDPKAAARLVATVARAIHHAHEKGIIHRDLKPANILIDDEGRPIVTDFGLAKEISDAAALTRSGAAVGTPLYMSPEQVAGRSREIGPATDIYALGAILYELLTGRPPFLGETVGEIYAKILRDPPTDARGLDRAIPAELSAICRKALEKDAAARYGSAEAMAQDLDRFLAGQSVVAMKTHLISQIGRAVRRNPGRIAAAALAVVALASGLAYLRWSSGHEQAWRGLMARATEEVSTFQRMDSLTDGFTEYRRKTRATIDEVLAFDRGRIDGHLLLIRLQMHGSRNAEAALAVAEALRIAPDHPRVVYWSVVTRLLDHLYSLRSWSAEEMTPLPEPIAAIRRDRERLRGTGEIRPYELELIDGLLAMAERRFAEAASNLSRFLEVERSNTKALEFRGVARKQSGDLKGALQDFSDVIRSFPTDQTYLLRADTHLALGDATAALADLDRSSPKLALTWVGRGQALMKLGRRAEAVEAFSKSIDIDPFHGVGHLWRAWSRRMTGDLDGALSDCEESLRLGASPAALLFERGQIYFAQQRWDLAMEDCGRAAAGLAGRERGLARSLQVLCRYHVEKAKSSGADWPGLIRQCDDSIEEEAGLAGPYVTRAIARYEKILLEEAPPKEDVRRILADARKYLELAPDGAQKDSAMNLRDDALKRLGPGEEH